MDANELVRQIREARARVEPLLPDMDPQDLVLILECLLRPVGTGRVFLLRPHGDGFIF